MTRTLGIDDLAGITVPGRPALSPDGSRAVYALAGVDTDADVPTSSLWIAEPGSAPRRLTRGRADSAPVLSPDGAMVAFLRDGQLWTLPLTGGEAEQRTRLPIEAGEAVFSPDGSRIAFAAPVDRAAVAGETGAARARRDDRPVATDGIDHREDGRGLVRQVRMQIHLLDLVRGTTARVTEMDAHATSPAWSPDGTRIAFVAKPQGGGDLDFRRAVHVLDVDDPAASPAVVALADGTAQTVTYAPDDALVVVGWTGRPTGIARLYRVDPRTGRASELAEDLDRTIMPGGPGYPGGPPCVTESGDVVFAARERGCTHLYAVPLEGGTPRPVLGGAGRVVSGFSVAGDFAAAALATPTSFGEIVRVTLRDGMEGIVTEHGGPPGGAELLVREPREFEISDGVRVEGWIVRHPETAGPTPLLVDVHGGPHNAWNGAADAVHLHHQELAARGWTVLLLNPRGSDGYGERFFTAVDGAWGEADGRDILEPIDALVADGTADPKRLAITGYSYGGFLTCYLTGRDSRFSAAAAGGVVSDLTSMGGTSDIAHMLNVLDLQGFPWDPADRERLARLSPLTCVDQVRTPTLVLHGEADLRCPVGQAEQWHRALREQGVSTRLVLYPGADHVFPLSGLPSHRMDYGRRVVDWVERFAGSASGPRPAAIEGSHWQRRLRALAERHGVPGAQLGILRNGNGDDEVVVGVHGTLNRNIATGAPVTRDSIFQIGSISKVWTATVVMRLAEEGRLSLDTRVVDILPDLALADEELTEGVTVRHLLTHTSGLDGDVFTDTGRGDDALEKYTALLRTAAKNHPLGATWSYCNSGFSILGRVIEVVTGTTWDTAMHDLLHRPLGLAHTVTLPEEAILHAAAVGHVEAGGDQVVAPAYSLPRSAGPAGLIVSRAEDVLAFARMHMRGGIAGDGTRLLDTATVTQMQAFQAEVPDPYVLGDSWGLGWIRFDWNGERLYGHDGNTIGQSSFLRVHPASGLAVVLLTNGGSARDLYQELFREVFAEIAGVDMQPPVQVPETPVDADVTPFIGTYERASMRMEVFRADDGPRLRTTTLGPLAELVPDPVEEHTLVPLGGDLFAVRAPGTRTWATVTFYSLPGGAEYVHFGARATPKVAGPA